MVGDKIRFRFRKSGDLRLLSHLDLTRCFERMLRRADLAFKSSQGFHPTPRMIFALSLPLGVVGDEEVLELELLAPDDPDAVRERLNKQTPSGLDFHGATVVPMKATAMARRVQYTLAVPSDRIAETNDRIRAMMDSPKVWVDRLRPRPRQLNIRQYLRAITLQPMGTSPVAASFPNCRQIQTEPQPSDTTLSESIDGKLENLPPQVSTDSLLTLDLWVTPSGTARADELLKALNLTDLVDGGRIVSRSLLEIHDETTPGQPDAPPDLPPESAPLNHTPAEAGTENEPAVATWGLSPNGPVVE